jgi:MFS transporter, DHA1 family, multidrug resistance protein
VTAATLDPAAGAARGALVRMCAAGFFAYCSYAICRSPLLPLYARELGAAAPMVGLVVGASTVTGIFLKWPAGAWSDVLGRRPLLVAGALVFALMPFGYLGGATLAGLVALRLVHGSATAIFGPVASASLSDIAPAGRRGAFLATYSSVQAAGQALGPVLAGYLIASGTFASAFLLSGLLGLAVPLLVARWPGSPPEPPREGRWARLRLGFGEVARHPLILATSGAQAALFVLNGALSAFLPLYGAEALRLGAAELGWLFATQTLAILLIRPLAGAISDRSGRPAMIVGGLTVCGLTVLLVPLVRALPGLVAVLLVYAAGVAVTTASASAYITDLAQRAHYGAAHGVFGTLYDVGDAAGPIAGGLLVAALGYAGMFRTVAGVALLAALTFHWLAGRMDPVSSHPMPDDKEAPP